ncbi:unnamed protein product [Haemonchus placei]|uniref:Secreted protein n=1 Tax=Haemonchus placei TaxID=6290 RepID=A0A0N4X3V5_HAEPC|nr:unnamed protein product [Haemonchus placei]
MFVVLTALISISGNVASQGLEIPLPEGIEKVFKTLNGQYNEDLLWSNGWANKALEWLNSKGNVTADVIVMGKEYFPKGDNRSLEEKLLAILKPRFENEYFFSIANLPAYSVYGCNFIANPKGNEDYIRAVCLYLKLPLIVTHNVPQGSEAPLPKELEVTFKSINSKYSNKTEWSDDWAKKALEWLKSPGSVEADVTIKGKGYFPIAGYGHLWQKVYWILVPRFDKKKKIIEHLPEGTVYGCNGFMNTKGKKKDFIYTACLYKRP